MLAWFLITSCSNQADYVDSSIVVHLTCCVPEERDSLQQFVLFLLDPSERVADAAQVAPSLEEAKYLLGRFERLVSGKISEAVTP